MGPAVIFAMCCTVSAVLAKLGSHGGCLRALENINQVLGYSSRSVTAIVLAMLYVRVCKPCYGVDV